jgi:hypothetical protein
MTMKTTERDASMTAAYLSVAVSGVVLLAGAGVSSGARTSMAVALGVVIALSNLWVVERLVRLTLENAGGRWAVIALVKAAILFGLVALLVKSGAVDVLPLVVGFGSLPLGVVVAGVWPVTRAPEES